MGFIELNEKLVSWPKIGPRNSFETIAVGFCKRTANVIFVQFSNKFFTAREFNDRQNFQMDEFIQIQS